MNEKSIFKKLQCPQCKAWKADSTGKTKGLCKCGTPMYLSDNWHVRLTRDGHTFTKSVSPRRPDAVDLLHSIKDTIRQGKLLPWEEPDVTWQDAAKSFKTWYESSDLSPNTQQFYAVCMRNLERVDVGGVRFTALTLQEIEPKHLTAYKQARLAQVANKTVHSEMITLIRLYSHIIETHTVRKYPSLHAAYTDLINVKKPDINNEKTRYLDREGVINFLNCIERPHMKLIFIIGVKTMLRVENILHLRKSQIDFENHQITIPRREMKSKGSRPAHVIPIDSELETMLKDWIVQNRTFDYIFPSPRDATKPVNNINKDIAKALATSGVNAGVTDPREMITFNVATRHTGATLLLEETGDIHSVSKLLDHSNISITDKRYVKKVNEKLHRVIGAMGDVFKFAK